jgi:hypothetical protein
MKELLAYRIKMIERLREAAREFRLACEAFDDPYVTVEGTWTLHQIAAHVRDVNKFIYSARVHQTINENNPEFKSFDADEWMLRHYETEESLIAILDEFTTNVRELCDSLQAQPREAWSRVSKHETMGNELTMQLWVERSLAHIEEHLETLKKAKNK